MKKITFLLLAIIAFGLSSCKDENDSSDAQDLVTGLSLDKSTLSLAVGATSTLTATVTPIDATDKTIIWTSSNYAVATVTNGVVKAVAAGTAIITAQTGTQIATCEVTVSAPVTNVLINGIYWAPYNVATPGTFATSSEASGMFYQWNSKVGWPTTGDIGSIKASDGSSTWNGSWNGGFTTASTSDIWSSNNDPSPAGYRVPTYAEIQTLLDGTKVTSTWTTQNSVKGRKFTDKTTGNTIFMPASGYRSTAGALNKVGAYGDYWCNKSYASNANYADFLDFDSTDADWYYYSRSVGYCIRPVAK